MGTRERREREREELRGKILEAARDMFVEEGYGAVSMRKIAEKIEYSPTAIYLHFPDKEALFRSLCMMEFTGLGERMHTLASVADPLERVRALGKMYVEHAIEHPNAYRFMFLAEHPDLELDEEQERVKGDPAKDAYALLRTTCAEAIEKGLVRPDLKDPDLMAQLCWAGVHGIAALWITRASHDRWTPFRPAKKATAAMLDVMVAGLKAGAKPRR